MNQTKSPGSKIKLGEIKMEDLKCFELGIRIVLELSACFYLGTLIGQILAAV